ncbi:hypothetical protein Tco_0178820 [Tanacetum coccineum]
MEQMKSICDMVGQYMQKKEEDKQIAKDQAAKDRYWKIPICYDDDDDEESSIPLKDIIIFGLPSCVAITPVLSTEEPVDSLIMKDEYLDTISATESDEVIKSSVEDLVTIPSESEEKSSGVLKLHCYFYQYDSFIFDLSIDSFPPADRSDFYHEEFADELAHIISPPEYDCFYFKSEPDPGELTSIVDSGIRENVLSTTNVNLPFEDDQSPLLAYVVWIFLPFLTIARIFEASRARGFVLRSLELQILSFILGIRYPNLID